MPLVYADSSALFAYFHPCDAFSDAVDSAARAHAPDFVWWRLLQFEVRHNLRLARGDADGEAAWRALHAAEKNPVRRRSHPELDPKSLLDAAEELSADKSREVRCGAADVWHVAAARRVMLGQGLDEFWTCDEA